MFGITLELLWDVFGINLVARWVNFGLCLGKLWDHFALCLESLWENFGSGWGKLGFNTGAFLYPSRHPGAIGQMTPTGFGYGYDQFGTS